ncbi:MAG: protein kinase [Pseudomonadota bacterium]
MRQHDQIGQGLLLALEQLISGERSLGEFRDEMLNVLYEHPSRAKVTHDLINDYYQRGQIPEQIHRLLSRDIDKATADEIPTTQAGTGETTALVPMAATTPLARTAIMRQPVIEPPPDDAGETARVQALRIGELLRDRFEIIARAPGGSMGIVYKAIDRRLAEVVGGEPIVAIKVISPTYDDRDGALRALSREAARCRLLKHPNIVSFLDFDRDNQHSYLVMEWLEGRSLSDVLSDRPGEALPLSQSLKIIQHIGDALAYAHAAGITHADVKPGNVMLLDDGGIKLLDFGIARADAGGGQSTVIEEEDSPRAATPAFSSPTVLNGEPAQPVDDVFSLAAMAYRLFSGRRPFRDSTSLEWQREGRLLRQIPGLARRHWSALQRALSLRDIERTLSVSEFLDAMGLARQSRASAFWPTAGIAAMVGILAVLFVLALRSGEWSAEPEPPVAQTPLTEQVDGVGIQPRTPPEIVFTVDQADLAAPDGLGTVLSLQLPMAADDIPEFNLSEGAGLASVLLTPPPGTSGALLIERGTRGSLALQDLIDGVERPDSAPLAYGPDAPTVRAVFENLADTRVEPDAILPIRILDAQTREPLGAFRIRLLDDDRRQIEAQLLPDTVSFASNDVTVSESTGVLRLAMWRFQRTNEPLEVQITVTPLSATPDVDFVLPQTLVVRFEASISRAELLVPLVIDDVAESTEIIDLSFEQDVDLSNVFNRVTVRILDGG